MSGKPLLDILPSLLPSPPLHLHTFGLLVSLNAIKAVSVWTVNIVMPHIVIPRPAFGVLVATNQWQFCQEDERFLGITFDSCVFPQQNRAGTAGKEVMEFRATVMIRAEPGSEIDNDESATHLKVQQTAMKAVERVFGMRPNELKDANKTIYSKFNANCIPQYTVGHAGHVASIHRSLEGLASYPSSYVLPSPFVSEPHVPNGREQLTPVSLLGVQFYGVSLNDTIHHARHSVDDYLHHFEAKK